MDWILLPLLKADESIAAPGLTAWSRRKPQAVGKARLQIKLNTTVADTLVSPLPDWSSPNVYDLSTAAYEPRTFTIAIEKGNFAPKSWIGHEGGLRQRHELRLLFDRSPYPMREGLKTPDDPPLSGFEFDGLDIFVAKPLPQAQTKAKAMNDDTSGFTGAWMVSLFRR